MNRTVAIVLGAVFAYAFVRDYVVEQKLRSAATALRKVVPL